jgi:hypothetical protein
LIFDCILGHNWGSEHDPDTVDCAPDTTDNGKYIMYYRATTGYEPNNQVSLKLSHWLKNSQRNLKTNHNFTLQYSLVAMDTN